MNLRAVLPWVPLMAAGGIALVLGFGGVGTGLLLGIAAFVGLWLARRPFSLQFAAWTLAGAVAFGFSAGVFAGLVGLSVTEMIAAGAQHWVGNTLAVLALALASLGLMIAAAAMLSERRRTGA